MITVQEDRESTDRQLPKPSSLSLKRNLHLSLKALPRESNGFHKIQCKFERIELKGQFDDQPIHYDSDRDQPGKGNAIADLLSNIVGVKFHISITPEGVFKQLSGLDATWRAKGLLIAPAPMLGIQFLFRDQAMLQLLTATLSPPLPPDTSIKGFTYQHRQPVEIPFVALLVWPATFTITGNERINGGTCVHIIAKGDIKTARLPGDIGKAGLRASVVKGHRQSDLYISPDAREVIRNEITHKLALSVKLNPPAGGDSPIMDLRQQITIVATRLKN
ncbi:MAG: hypothetical protein JSV03_01285 [Planctomycetota bacterium]|nr:MAG: hypothetical protein JSV03_01285 [Planctomycetota bacterium]